MELLDENTGRIEGGSGICKSATAPSPLFCVRVAAARVSGAGVGAGMGKLRVREKRVGSGRVKVLGRAAELVQDIHDEG